LHNLTAERVKWWHYNSACAFRAFELFGAPRGPREQLRAHRARAWSIPRSHMPVPTAQVLNGSRRYPRRRDLFGWIRGNTRCCGWHHTLRRYRHVGQRNFSQPHQ
jgi:hypothetical protein